MSLEGTIMSAAIVVKFHSYGFQVGRLHVTWIDLWTREYGLWIEWDRDPSQATIDRWHVEAARLTDEVLNRARQHR